jgi:hypothetical protein
MVIMSVASVLIQELVSHLFLGQLVFVSQLSFVALRSLSVSLLTCHPVIPSHFSHPVALLFVSSCGVLCGIELTHRLGDGLTSFVF